ncbi:MAG: outer membrane beta-barrel protein [Rhizomicrobium sp.]
MKVRKLVLISASVASLLAGSSAAEAASTYVSIFGGATILQQPGLRGTSHTRYYSTYTFSSKQSVDTSFKTGFVVGGNWGVDWGSFRTEIEAAYHGNKSGKTGRVTTTYQGGYIGGPVFTSSAKDAIEPVNLRLNAYSLMANVWYDFHDFEQSLGGVTPYVGAGVGLAQIQIGGSINNVKLIEKNDFTFAWQVGAGVSVPVLDNVKFFVDYRYFAADGANLKINPGYHGGDVKADFDSHELLVGFRIKA